MSKLTPKAIGSSSNEISTPGLPPHTTTADQALRCGLALFCVLAPNGNNNPGFGIMVTEGQCVQISESEAGIVLEVATMLDGKPVYKVLRAFDDQGDGGTTYVLSALPIELGGHLCRECPLFYDGRCGLNQLDLAA